MATPRFTCDPSDTQGLVCEICAQSCAKSPCSKRCRDVLYNRKYRQRPDVKRRRSENMLARRRESEEERMKVAARRALYYAIEKGRMQKGHCEVCGAIKVEAHHDDYSKPLDVRWLCNRHHIEVHAMMKAAA